MAWPALTISLVDIYMDPAGLLMPILPFQPVIAGSPGMTPPVDGTSAKLLWSMPSASKIPLVTVVSMSFPVMVCSAYPSKAYAMLL